MYLKVRGLVLRLTDYNDRDALLTLLTENYGKLTVKARGLRRKNSPLAAPCQLLVFGEYTLFEYKGMYTVNEAHCIELFKGVRSDIQKLSLGSYFAQVAEVISQEDMPNPELLSLVLNCLYALSEMDISQTKIKAVFELRSACLAGYTPDLTGCCQCGNPNPERFDVSSGTLECAHCRNSASSGLRLPITASVTEAMRYIVGCHAKKLFAFQTSDETVELLSQASEVFFTTQLERSFSALALYKSLLLE